VFLLSVRSGAVGINLTAADHVFLLEPCINPALEEQAGSRAPRAQRPARAAVSRLRLPAARGCLIWSWPLCRAPPDRPLFRPAAGARRPSGAHGGWASSAPWP
jgi:hypothetical protein